jgi:hypothetical protein
MSAKLSMLYGGLRALVAELQKLDPAGVRRELRLLAWRQDEETCPFCGCKDIGVDQRGLSFVGYCEECDAEGPPTHTREKARELWKRRIN